MKTFINCALPGGDQTHHPFPKTSLRLQVEGEETRSIKYLLKYTGSLSLAGAKRGTIPPV